MSPSFAQRLKDSLRIKQQSYGKQLWKVSELRYEHAQTVQNSSTSLPRRKPLWRWKRRVGTSKRNSSSVSDQVTQGWIQEREHQRSRKRFFFCFARCAVENALLFTRLLMPCAFLCFRSVANLLLPYEKTMHCFLWGGRKLELQSNECVEKLGEGRKQRTRNPPSSLSSWKSKARLLPTQGDGIFDTKESPLSPSHEGAFLFSFLSDCWYSLSECVKHFSDCHPVLLIKIPRGKNVFTKKPAVRQK